MASEGASGADRSDNDRSSDRSSKADRADRDLSDASRETLSGGRRDASPDATAADREASQAKMASQGAAAKDRVEAELSANDIRGAIERGIARAAADPVPAGSYEVAEAAPDIFNDAIPAQVPGQGTAPPGATAPANDNRPPQTATRPATGTRPTGAGRGVGLAAVAEALAEPGLANLNARDIAHLDREYGIQLDPANPVDAEIAMEYTLNRGRSELTRAIADNIARGYAPETMPEAEAVAIVEDRLETRAAERTAAALAALSAETPTMEDDACAPGHLEGNWELVSRPGMSDAARDYQRQISQTPDLGTALVEYRVTDPVTGATALFDGCAHWSPERALLEAKDGYGGFLEMAETRGFEPTNLYDQVTAEALRQREAVGPTHPVEWHLSDPRALDFFTGAVSAGAGSTNFSVQVTPAL